MAPTDLGRVAIHRIFSKEHSLILRGDGLRWIQDVLSHYRVAPVNLEDTLNVLANEIYFKKCTKKISTMTATESHEVNEDPDLPPESNHILELQTLKVIDTFSIPRLRWSEEQQVFEEPTGESSKPSLLGQPLSKISYLRDRYYTIRQVIFRNEHFSPPAVAGALGQAESEEYMKDQTYCLEDLEGNNLLTISYHSFRLLQMNSLCTCQSAAEGLFTGGFLVLAEGEYLSNKTFRVLEIGHPPLEQQGASRKLFTNSDSSGAGPLSLAGEARLKKREKNSDSQFIV
ncbi:hypothetical protein H4Q26_016988 [Puccinia striiformis f. sp. tritici PST-130]|nr:hypothetical protein H4Q26_016988 [Puccinia striiformis f. sp. tritici PST-130]